jgi:hypothetical protein
VAKRAGSGPGVDKESRFARLSSPPGLPLKSGPRGTHPNVAAITHSRQRTPRPGRCLPASLVVAGVLLGGCTSITTDVKDLVGALPPGLRLNSLYRDVDRLLADGRLREARVRLDEAGVGDPLRADALKDRDREAARRTFTEQMNRRFLESHRSLVREGRPRAAAAMLAEAVDLCQWCWPLREAPLK